MKNLNFYFLLSLLVIFSACEKNEIDTQEPDSGIQDLQGLSIPDGFNFETERAVTMTINDETPNVLYTVYGYSSRYGNEAENIANALNNVIYNGKPTAGVINQAFSLSNAYDKVYISRKDGIEYSFEIKDVINNVINFSSPLEVKSKDKPYSGISGNRTTNCDDCTQIWTNGDFEDNLGDGVPPGSVSFIQTDENNVDGWFTTASDNLIEVWDSGYKGFVSQDGVSHAEINATQEAALYQRVCTTPNAEFTWSVWHRGRKGVDVATVKIGKDLPSAVVVETMVTDKDAWVNYTGTYTVPAGQDDTFLIFQAVSTANNNNSTGNFIDNIELNETVVGDPCGGGTITYPGGITPARLAFEDLWPAQGDYDFNDLVVRYSVIQNLVPGDATKVESMDYVFTIDNDGAGYKNGLAIEFPGIAESQIKNVTGQLDGLSGTSAGANGAVVQFFSQTNTHVGIEYTVTLHFNDGGTTGIDLGAGAGQLDVPPYNPYLIENVGSFPSSEYEVHLPDHTHTGTTPALRIPGFAPLFAQTDVDSDNDYKVDSPSFFTVENWPEVNATAPHNVLVDDANMPWAINITGPFVPPLPGEYIGKGHLKFREWAQSGGVDFPDWFLNLPGYRDNTYLDN